MVLTARAATFTCVNCTFHVFAINIYKIGLLFTQTLVCDQRRGLLIAFPNEHPDLDHQSSCCFFISDSAVFDN